MVEEERLHPQGYEVGEVMGSFILAVIIFGVQLAGAMLITWLADGTTMEAVIMFALMDLGRRIPS